MTDIEAFARAETLVCIRQSAHRLLNLLSDPHPESKVWRRLVAMHAGTIRDWRDGIGEEKEATAS